MIGAGIVVYVGAVLVYARRVVLRLELDAQERLLEESAFSQRLASKKDTLYREKMRLENETVEIFTLYEMTKEITKSLRQEEALEIFKKKLSEHVVFEECLLLDPLSEESKEYKKSPEYFLFSLRGKGRKIGQLIVKGLGNEDKEKFSILANQFALALRRIDLYEEIERIAITDSLTQVYTRRYVLERFQEELRRSKTRRIPLSFLMMDVDFFKNFNDTYGHLTGDQILRGVGGLIQENIREIDIAGRYGGEEFCVVLPDTDRKGAQYAAERIRRAAEEAVIKAYDTQVKITLSAGVATCPADGEGLEDLIGKADAALYRAKKEGRNKVCA